MKVTPLLTLSHAVTTTAIPQQLIPSINHASLVRHISTSSESCQQDMTELGLDSDLSSSLEDTLNTFSSSFDANPLEYCKSISSSGQIHLDCVIDYESFSSNYKSMCRSLEAVYFPISLFMQCSSEESNVEMELVNVPSCLAHECNGDEVTEALGRLLMESSAETSKSDTFHGFTCSYFQRRLDIDRYTALSFDTDVKFDGLDKGGSNPRSRIHHNWWVLLGASTVVIATLVGLKYNKSKKTNKSSQFCEDQPYFGEYNFSEGNILIDMEKGGTAEEEIVEILVI